VRILLLPAQETNPGCQGAALDAAVGQEIRRVHVVVHRRGVGPIGDVVESRPQRPQESEQANAPLQLQVQRKILGETPGAWSTYELLVLVHQAEGKSVAPIERISEIELPGQGHPTPGEKAIRRIPGERPARLRAEQQAINAEVKDSVGVGPRARVRSEDHVAALESVARRNLHGVVAVLLQTFQPEIAAEAAALVDKSPAVASSFLEELKLEVNGMRHFPFNAQAPIGEARNL